VTVYWTVFICLIIVGFIAGESYALAHDKTTLSRYVWTASKEFPPLPAIFGLVVGFLTCHFWWGGAFVCFTPP
jgi:hypothetical protein